MPKFVSRHIEIEAVLFDGHNHAEMLSFAGEGVTLLGDPGNYTQVNVHTLNGTVELLRTHWLIRGENDYYPCDPDTFDRRWMLATGEVDRTGAPIVPAITADPDAV